MKQNISRKQICPTRSNTDLSSMAARPTSSHPLVNATPNHKQHSQQVAKLEPCTKCVDKKPLKEANLQDPMRGNSNETEQSDKLEKLQTLHEGANKGKADPDY